MDQCDRTELVRIEPWFHFFVGLASVRVKKAGVRTVSGPDRPGGPVPGPRTHGED